MATIDDLEAALRTGLDRDVVAVYGDQLQASGDVRGELIAIDLRIEDSGTTPALITRRAELMQAWLGTTLPNGTIRFGFVDLDATSADPIAQARVAFEGAAAAYVRSVAIVGPPRLVAAALAIVAARPRPSLVELTIRQWSELETPAVRDAALRAFVGATPHLRALELDGRNVFAELVHPSVRKLRISGYDAISSAIETGYSHAQLSELDFAFHCHLASRHETPPPEKLVRLLRADRLPALTHLDLSRNEPGYQDPFSLGGTVTISGFVRDLAIRSQLVSLRLPSLADAVDVANVRAALDDMPALRELEIVRAQPGLEDLARRLAHPTATIRRP